MDKQFDELVKFITNFIRKRLLDPSNDNRQLRQNLSPEELQNLLDLELPKQGLSNQDILEIIEQVIDHSVLLDHPYFMNQMFGKTQPIAFLADIIISLLNASMYTFEVAPVLTLIEKEVVNKLAEKVWGKNKGDGVFTSGGSMSNMNALFMARQNYLEHTKQKGLFNEKPFSIFVSDQAHYSFTKGVNYLGFGTDSLIKIPSDNKAKIRIDYLKKAIEKSKKEGRIPLMLIGIAGTTISGSLDDLETLSQIAKEHNMWYHIDAAFGGSFLFSKKLKQKLKGIENADSVTWNFHKVMGMTLSTASFLTREKGLLKKGFEVDAGYLFHDNDNEYDLGLKSLQGGRRPDAFKLWLSWKYVGENSFADHVEKLNKAANKLASYITHNEDLELYNTPETAIVCFRFKPNGRSLVETNALNQQIRQQIFEEGKMIFNYSTIKNTVYLRCVILDPNINDDQLEAIIKKVVQTAKQLLVSIE